MMKKRMHKLWLFLITVLPAVGWGQGYRFSAKIDAVPQTGFYSMTITPAIAAHVKIDFSDVRIWNDEKQNVPHLLRSHYIKKSDGLFVGYPIIKNTIGDSGRSEILILNIAQKPIDHFTIFIKNTSVVRFANLSGSNNKSAWFTIKEHFPLGPSYSNSSDSGMQDIAFPASNYKYFKVVIDNEGKDPLNIIGAGETGEKMTDVTYDFLDNPKPVFTQTDSSNHVTYIRVDQGAAYHTHKIELEIDAPKFYERTVQIYTPGLYDTSTHLQLGEFIASINVSSKYGFSGMVPYFKNRIFYLVIENNDNPPLKIASIATAQQKPDLVAYLEQGKNYQLMLDNPTVEYPSYDLNKFIDSIPSFTPTISVGPIKAVIKDNFTQPETKSKNLWLWPVIGVVLLLLGLLTWQLTKDLKKEKEAGL